MKITITADSEKAIIDTRRIADLRGVKLGLAAAALHLEGLMKQYPPSPGGRPQPPKTDKQRKFLHMAVRKGIIQIPYVRGSSSQSEKLGQSWTTRAENGGLRQVVGTSASYAPLVQGERQSEYHKVTGWKQADNVVRAESATLGNIVNSYIDRDIRG